MAPWTSWAVIASDDGLVQAVTDAAVPTASRAAEAEQAAPAEAGVGGR